MGKFNEYSQKATPADNDTLMIYDATAKANKLSPFSGIWNWIVEKLTNAVIANLQTNDKTVLGAINELNSNRLTGLAVKTNETAILPIHVYSSALILGTVNSNVFGFYLVSRGETESIYITPLTKNSKSDDFTITPIDAYKVSIQTKINTEMKVIY
jgi:hypothetical protein